MQSTDTPTMMDPKTRLARDIEELYSLPELHDIRHLAPMPLPSDSSTDSEVDIVKSPDLQEKSAAYDFKDIEIQELPPPDVATSASAIRPAPPVKRFKIACVAVVLLAVWAGWTVYIYYFWVTNAWPVPRVWLNTQNGAATGLAGVLSMVAAGITTVLVKIVAPASVAADPRRRRRNKILSNVVIIGLQLALAACINVAVMASVLAGAASCGDTTPVPVFIFGSSASVFDVDSIGSSLVAEFSLSQDGPSSFSLSQVAESDPNLLLVSYDLAAGVASVPGLNVTANFTSGAVGPIDFPSMDIALELIGPASTRPVKFSLRDSSAAGSGDIILLGGSRSPVSSKTIKLCAARIPSSDEPTLLVPLGLAMYYQSSV